MVAEQTLLGESPAFLSMLRTAGLLAPTDATVLITGESGTGKELLARHIHRKSRRRNGPWISINCAALPVGLAESELFGHIRGAFTGAQERRAGRVQAAAGGTLFLDEVSELPPAIQPKLLRLLESGECQVVGQPRVSQVDIRVIAATNRDLRAWVQSGRFRADLFFRLNVAPLALPPLRERPGDVPVLVQAFLEAFSTKNLLEPPRFSKTALARLGAHPWPGNIRELRNLCERVSILKPAAEIGPNDLPEEFLADGAGERLDEDSSPFVLPEGGVDLARLEQSLIVQALMRASGNKSRAARMLGLSRDAFLYRLKKFAIQFS